MVALYVIGIIFSYIFLACASGTRHHSIVSRICPYSNCFNDAWCSHVYSSVWLYGVLWPFMIPAGLGMRVGKTDGISRSERRRNREIEDAKHKQELAKINAETVRIKEMEAGIG